MPAPTTRPRAAPPAARRTALGALLVTALLAGGGAHAQPAVSDKPASNALSNVKPWQRPATLGEVVPGVTLGLQAEGGILFSPTLAGRGENFGHLFTDEPNRPLLNQILFIAGRDAGSRTAGYDYGFKLALLYGSDARIVHTLGVFDRLIEDRNQLALLEANVTARLPWFGKGVDLKAGIYTTPLGFETIDPKTSPFYSRSYIFNFGLPFKHTGALASAHLSDTVDLYFGVDTGANTSFGRGGDNNDRPGGIAGFGLNFAGGKFTVVALTHIGPENPTRSTPFGNSALRYYNDVVFNYKPSDKLAFTTEFNYVRDDGFRADAYGVAQYAFYSLGQRFALNVRAEVWRDNANFFAFGLNDPLGYVDHQRGVPVTLITPPRPGTYGELTLGLMYRPTGLPAPVSNLLIRPEIRYDRTLNGARAFNGGRDVHQFTFGADVVLGF